MKSRSLVHHVLRVALFATSLAAPASAAPFASVLAESFDAAELGPAVPSGWTAQPATTGVWQIVATPDRGRAWRLAGVTFDRSGNAAATCQVDGITSRPWRLASDFSLRAFAFANKAGLARFGLGALGQRPLFANAAGSESAKFSYYLADVRVSANDDPASLTPVLRIVRFDDRGIAAVLVAETQFSRMPIRPGDQLRLVLNGTYAVTGALTLEAQLMNITQDTVTPVIAGTDSSPLTGIVFGYRHSEGRTGLTALDLWNDNFSVSIAQ